MTPAEVAADFKRMVLDRIDWPAVTTPLQRPPGWRSRHYHYGSTDRACTGCLLDIADQLDEIIADFDARRDAESAERLRAYAAHTAAYLELRFE